LTEAGYRTQPSPSARAPISAAAQSHAADYGSTKTYVNRQRAFNARRQRATTRDTRRAGHTRVRAVIRRWHRRPGGRPPSEGRKAGCDGSALARAAAPGDPWANRGAAGSAPPCWRVQSARGAAAPRRSGALKHIEPNVRRIRSAQRYAPGRRGDGRSLRSSSGVRDSVAVAPSASSDAADATTSARHAARGARTP